METTACRESTERCNEDAGLNSFVFTYSDTLASAANLSRFFGHVNYYVMHACEENEGKTQAFVPASFQFDRTCKRPITVLCKMLRQYGRFVWPSHNRPH